METVDCVVIGAGAVGLAIARALAMRGREVIVVESARGIGTGNSSRNSEVIHAGIYYPPGSLMAKFCVAGRQALYAYCRSQGIAFETCGKLIVATNEAEAGSLGAIQKRAALNGVELTYLASHEARRLNPELACVGALFSPLTGILDSHGFMLALQAEMEAHGGVLALESPALGGRLRDEGIELEIGGADPMRLNCRSVVNSAGLGASALARRLEGLDAAHVPETYLAKGNYFSLSGQRPQFAQLIYPVPAPGGLGVHLTFDLAHQMRFGPDVEWIEQESYTVDPDRARGFYEAIRRYWPGLQDGALQPAYCGVRPKLAPEGAPAQDFRISGPREHGVRGLVNLFGVESPGLTAALAIADHVVRLIDEPQAA
ncbi:FAD dependent oxidoreductase [Methylocella silvestris BL2]|uniref:FAD dependent oxidoreductase n=1 Tax=Methylocella silvestris (strain DSM 15510 / CIP 108128 / LMG 27833 / NCIMB 13906 / BL2) TaxID=395965 RepID=B8EJG7_METSB|nr:NAD(P)/FAD-dependent oxidoreductase [Methylocella silvestris]ACK52659.1 FAD dependent oxidoreductase [Methylocella silvestris BL2]